MKVIALAYLAEQPGQGNHLRLASSFLRSAPAKLSKRLKYVLNTAFENAVLTDETYLARLFKPTL